jgi:collagen triple helix repeat protein
MRTSNLRRMLARLTAIAAAAGATAASANTMNVCVDKRDGDMRVVLSSRFCHRDEAFLTLAVCADDTCNDFRGPAGAAGAQGIAGPTGPVGPKGDIGAVGPQGAAGLQGSTGAVGAVGPQGLKGDIGPVGPQGAQGLAGNVGPQGPQGPQGMLGPMGAVGPQGPVGPSGTGGGGASVIANADSVFTRHFLQPSDAAATVAVLDLTPGSWVIVGKAMATALEQAPNSEATCVLVSGIGGSGANLDYHAVAMNLNVHNTITMAAPFTVTGSADGHVELQCQTMDTTPGLIENAQVWAVQVGTLNATASYPQF